MAMHNPPHSGGIVRRQCLEPLGLSVTKAAQALGVTRQALAQTRHGQLVLSTIPVRRSQKPK